MSLSKLTKKKLISVCIKEVVAHSQHDMIRGVACGFRVFFNVLYETVDSFLNVVAFKFRIINDKSVSSGVIPVVVTTRVPAEIGRPSVNIDELANI